MWEDFDALCEAQNRAMDQAQEQRAISALSEEAERGAVTNATFIKALTLAEALSSWEVIVRVLSWEPVLLQKEQDEIFFERCPKPLLGKFLIDEEHGGLMGYFIRYKNEADHISPKLIRLMHLITDALFSLGQKDRVALALKMFRGVCFEKGGDGDRLPGTLYRKLVENGVLGDHKTPQNHHEVHQAPEAPARKVKAQKRPSYPSPQPDDDDPDVKAGLDAVRNGKIPGVTLTVAPR